MRLLTIYEFQIAIENIIKNYLSKSLNENTESNIINEVSDIIEKNSHLDLKEFNIKFDMISDNLKIIVTLPGTILNYEIKGNNI